MQKHMVFHSGNHIFGKTVIDKVRFTFQITRQSFLVCRINRSIIQ